MKKYQGAALAAVLLCVALPAHADVIALDGAVVLDNSRPYLHEGAHSSVSTLPVQTIQPSAQQAVSSSINDGDIVFYPGYNGGNSGGDAYIMRNGRFEHADDGVYDTGQGHSIAVQNGKVNGTVGNVQIINGK